MNWPTGTASTLAICAAFVSVFFLTDTPKFLFTPQALAVVFAASSMNVYAMFAWLPQLLVDSAKVTDGQAGTLLSLYAFIGLPGALLIPTIGKRVKRIGVLDARIGGQLERFGELLVHVRRVDARGEVGDVQRFKFVGAGVD